MPRQSKYLPLADFLATQETETITLPFTQIEALIDSPLPISAKVSTSFWRRNLLAGIRALHAVGWEARRVDCYGEAIVFARLQKEAVPLPRPTKCQPIADFLAAQHRDIVRVIFTEIETLLGFPLPENAQVD